LNKYNEFGIAGLESKRGKTPSPMRDRPKKSKEEIVKLKAENEYLKNILQVNLDNIKKKDNMK
jgi:hypothetical protein